MAKTQPSLTIPPAQLDLGFQAVWEIAALMQALAEHYGAPDDEDQRGLAIRGIALRAAELAGFLMAVLGDDVHAPGELRRIRCRVEGAAAASRQEGGAA